MTVQLSLKRNKFVGSVASRIAAIVVGRVWAPIAISIFLSSIRRCYCSWKLGETPTL